MRKALTILSSLACLVTIFGWFAQGSYKWVFFGTMGYIVISLIMFLAKIITIQSLGVDVLIFGIGFTIGGFVDTPSLLLGCIFLCIFELVISMPEVFREK